VTQLADALAISTFTIVGVSGGGPGALACAWKLPERLASVGIVACPAPPDAPDVFEGMSKTNRFFMKLARRVPRLSALNVRFLASMIRRSPARYIDAMKYKVHDVDKAILARPEIKELLVKDFTEALRSGSQGMVDDMNANHGRPWGFGLDEIKVEVHCWSCELDRSVPPAMGQYFCDTIPNCETEVVPDAGHLWVLENLHTVLHALVRAQPIHT
jgi:pimeloyl-ACP methyl ester carboxylesterase